MSDKPISLIVVGVIGKCNGLQNIVEPVQVDIFT